jgi:hypothetical protein
VSLERKRKRRAKTVITMAIPIGTRNDFLGGEGGGVSIGGGVDVEGLGLVTSGEDGVGGRLVGGVEEGEVMVRLRVTKKLRRCQLDAGWICCLVGVVV